MSYFTPKRLLTVLQDFKSRMVSYVDTKVSALETLVNNGEVEDFSSQITTNSIVKGKYVLKLQKLKRMVNLRLDLTLNEFTNTAKLGTIPTSLVANPKITINITTNLGKPCYLYVDADGTFGVTLVNSSTTFSSGDGIRVSLVYFV